jgi:hypothetical protein
MDSAGTFEDPAVRGTEIDGFALAVLCLKSQIPSTKLQINHKFKIPNWCKAIVILSGGLNFGSACGGLFI